MDTLKPENFKDYTLKDVFLKSNLAHNTTNDILVNFLKVKLYHKWIGLRAGGAKELLKKISNEESDEASLNLLKTKALLVFGKNLPEIENGNSFDFYGLDPNSVDSENSIKMTCDELNYIVGKIDSLAEFIHFSELPSIIKQVISQLNKSDNEHNLKENRIKEAINQIQHPTLFEDLILRMVLDEKLYPILEKNCKNFKVNIFSKFSKALNENGMVNCDIRDVLNQKVAEYLDVNGLETLSRALPTDRVPKIG